jgi:hypothetical protein
MGGDIEAARMGGGMGARDFTLSDTIERNAQLYSERRLYSARSRALMPTIVRA